MTCVDCGMPAQGRRCRHCERSRRRADTDAFRDLFASDDRPLLCYICRQPITGRPVTFTGEPVHARCCPDEGDAGDDDGGIQQRLVADGGAVVCRNCDVEMSESAIGYSCPECGQHAGVRVDGGEE